MKRIKLNLQEKEIEKDLLEGTYTPVNKQDFHVISQAIARRKKDSVLNIRINSHDLESIKQKARNIGVKYQTFISEILHKVAL
ncbi:MAG: hypothetical protein LHV68_08140 [Elusimicrobia bacterium]|nr:hypothetical protein [Candidatus Liberimonas magnetica]